tara:strand:+ start:38593 stop:40092 length:1500 start_codon:yes stop_codon:yes gene_type:complete
MIDKVRYLKLTEIFNDILRSTQSNLELTSIPWMHIIREHPIFLDRYEKLFRKDKFNFFFYNIWGIISWYYQIFKILTNNINDYWFSNVDNQKNVDYLFISHLINAKQFSTDDDMYFGKIPLMLAKKKKKVSIAYISYINKTFSNFKKYEQKSSLGRYFFSKALSFNKELEIRRKLKEESNRLRKLSKSEKFSNLKCRILHYASYEAKFNGAHFNMRLHKQVMALVMRLNPKIIINTYEGHAYERIIFHAARSVKPKIKCISYQHSIVFKLSNSIKIKLSKEYNPDLVFTSGHFGKIDLTEDLSPIPIKVLGSKRGVINLKNKNTSEKNLTNNTCLVIPEAFLFECNHLFNFSLKCAKINKNINFIWRLHPELTFETVFNKYKNLSNLPSNIYLSNDELENDIRKSGWVLYRGSSAVLKSISFGLRPLYLSRENEISIDPLFRMKNWKKIISKPEDLIALVKNDINNNFIYHKKYFKFSRNFCEKQFSNVEIDKIYNLLN